MKKLTEMSRQELLDYFLNRELEKLRKKCFKYQRRNFLDNKVIIKEDNLKDSTAGTHSIIEEKNRFNYTHVITIDSSILDKYINYKPDWRTRWLNHNKTYYKKEIIGIRK